MSTKLLLFGAAGRNKVAVIYDSYLVISTSVGLKVWGIKDGAPTELAPDIGVSYNLPAIYPAAEANVAAVFYQSISISTYRPEIYGKVPLPMAFKASAVGTLNRFLVDASITKDGTYTLASVNGSPGYYLIKFDGTNYTVLTAQSFGALTQHISWHMDGVLAIASTSAGAAAVLRRTGDSIALSAGTISPALQATLTGLRFNPKYNILVAGTSGASKLQVYYFSGVGDNLVAGTLTGTIPAAVTGIMWSPNGEYLAFTMSGSPYVGLCKRTGPTALTYIGQAGFTATHLLLGWLLDSSGIYVSQTSINSPVKKYKLVADSLVLDSAFGSLAMPGYPSSTAVL